jgi:probable rRNA maturation factor
MSPGSSSRAGRDSRRQPKAGIRRIQARIARPLRGESPESSVLFGALPSELRFSGAEKRLLTDFARELSRRIAPGRVFDCLITDDAELHRLNLAFLGNDYPTDVLSFPNGDARGEIAISIERAEAQARSFGHSRLDEIRILMLHGLLHLSGMDHENDRGEMARAEAHWRAQLGLPQTLIARTVA